MLVLLFCLVEGERCEVTTEWLQRKRRGINSKIEHCSLSLLPAERYQSAIAMEPQASCLSRSELPTTLTPSLMKLPSLIQRASR